MAGVEFDAVTKSFGKIDVLRELNLTIEDGEFFVLVGPSGCGKTTALRMVAGLESVTTGDIRVGGRSVVGVPPKDRNVSMVFQNYALFPHMTVFDNIAYGMRVRGEARKDINLKVGEAAERLGLTQYLKRRPANLSGGQRQRVALGRAIVREPEVFLLDEPLSNLDSQLRTNMRVELAQLHQQVGTTVIYVTHDQVEAMTLGHRLAVMKDGVLQQAGPPADVYRQPVNRFVATFLGTMNTFVGRVELLGGQSLLRTDQGGALDLKGTPPPWVGSNTIELGVRPEHLAITNDPLAGTAATVELVEQIGANTLVHLLGDWGRAIVMEPGLSSFEIGDHVGLRVGVDSCHWFDPDTGERRAGTERSPADSARTVSLTGMPA